MSNNYAISLKRSTALAAAITFMIVLTATNFVSVFSNRVGAAQLEDRSLTLSSTLPGTVSEGAAGSHTNGAQARHQFDFTKSAASDSADRVKLTYCTEAIGACTAVPGLDVTAATAAASPTGLTIVSLTNTGANVQTLTVSGVTAGAVPVSFALENVKNPDVIDDFYVRIELFDDASPGNILDDGTVASAITEGIQITSRVRETLGFSTTGDFATGVGDPGPACAPLTGSGAITLGETTANTLDMNTQYDNYSAFRLYTNAANGVTVQYEGDTLRKDPTNTIAPMLNTAAGTTGVEQFGLAIDTAVGGDGSAATGSPNSRSATIDTQYVDTTANLGTGGALTIDPDYADGGAVTPQFKFVPYDEGGNAGPQTIATTASYTNCKTAAVRYIANISPLTPAGTYTTTIVYSAVPQY